MQRSNLESKMRKQEKKLKRRQNVDVDDLIDEQLQEHLERPKWQSLLPFWFCRASFSTILNIPTYISGAFELYNEWKNAKTPEELDNEEAEEMAARLAAKVANRVSFLVKSCKKCFGFRTFIWRSVR